MKILIVDDNIENLEAAKEAAKRFPEQEFNFTNSAKEALVLLSKADAIITDLFFPNESHESEEGLGNSYRLYCSKVAKGPVFDDVVKDYYRGKRWEAGNKLDDVLSLLEDGTIRTAVERLLASFVQNRYEDRVEETRKFLKNLPAPQFPYGGALMLHAKELGKKHCLVSDIHRHAGAFKNAPGAVDGMILLLPLIEKEIISIEQARYDGENSLSYLGGEQVRSAGKGKNDSSVWTEAIRRTLAQ